MQFNQNAGMVEVQVFAKQLNKHKERVVVEIQETYLKVKIMDDSLQDTEYSLEEKLYQPIVVSASKWDVWSTQVNIKLKKADPAIVWPDLCHSDAPVRPLWCSPVASFLVLNCFPRRASGAFAYDMGLCAASARGCKHRRSECGASRCVPHITQEAAEGLGKAGN